MKRTIMTMALVAATNMALYAKTLVVYYSYTNNVHNIVTALCGQIDADVIRIEPAEKGLDYAANNYAIGSEQIAAIRNKPDDAAAYPAIDPVTVNPDEYDTVIIGAPAMVERHGIAVADVPVPLRQTAGRQAHRPDCVERKQRHIGGGSRREAPCARRSVPVTVAMDTVVTDVVGPHARGRMAENDRL